MPGTINFLACRILKLIKDWINYSSMALAAYN